MSFQSASGALDDDGGSFTAADAQRNRQAIIGNIFGVFPDALEVVE
jgi:hypothetical protein